jgi:MFS family permease
MAASLKPSFTEKFQSATGIYYGWVIVVVSTLLMGIGYGIMYSYSVFFKPILDTFDWDRATVSSVYSISLVLRGAVSILTGWLSDRYGPVKITSFCGIMLALGLVLSGYVDTLWQFYLTYGLILSIGLSGSFTIGSAVTSRWFNRKRAIALAITSTGSGIGTLTIVPLSERLIDIHGWQYVFITLGIFAGVLIISTSFLLRLPPLPDEAGVTPGNSIILDAAPEKSFKESAFSREMLMLNMIFSLILFCMHMVMIHLVNYATDMGISSLEAAGFISTIGVVSIAGRLVMGSASARIGTYNSLLICNILRIVSLFWIFFCKSAGDFYIFAIIFGFAYGGEIPQMPLFIGGLFGIKSMAGLMGLVIFVSNILGALGPYTGGRIYDLTSHYQYAFMLAFIFSIFAFLLAVRFKKTSSIETL